MDYETVRTGLAQAIPYNGHLGLELVEVKEGSGSVRLPDEEHLKNHVGSQHAGGLFSAGEFASGAASWAPSSTSSAESPRSPRRAASST